MDYLGTTPYRGTRDFLPEEMSVRTQIFERMFRTVEVYGFQRYHGPTLESAEIYEAKSGEEIANQQLYSLVDKGGRRLAIRPEMTPTVARIIAGNAGAISFPARWYSHASCHRYERPQRGRVREHWQLNVDIFGSDSIGCEIEIFEVVAAILGDLGATPDMYLLRVNDRILVEAALTNFVGVPAERLVDVSMAIDRWEKQSEEKRREDLAGIGLDAAAIARLEELVEMELPAYCEAAGPEASARSGIARILAEGACSAPLVFDPKIIRAFNYYTSTVFEVFDVSENNNRSIFGGGRYDDLVSLFSPKQVCAVGFGMGDVTTWNFLEANGLLPQADVAPQVYLFSSRDDFQPTTRSVCQGLRKQHLRSVPALEAVKLGNGFRQANKLGARFVVAQAEEEHARGCSIIKDLKLSNQLVVPHAEVASAIMTILSQEH